MTMNIPASVFNVLVLAFFVVVLLGVALGAYAAMQLKKCQEQLQQYKDAASKSTTPNLGTQAPEV